MHAVQYPATGDRKQVWVTADPFTFGRVKEKTRVDTGPEAGVRFQGEIPLVGGGAYLDRTTVIPLEEGAVRQRIERSLDGGATWTLSFDAIYRPIEPAREPVSGDR